MSFEPVYNVRSRALILGTWPSPKSREMAFYYGHPQNRFWPVLAALTGEPVKLWRAQVLDRKTEKTPGTVVEAGAQGIDMACGDGRVLRILELQAPGARRMAAADYLRGHPIEGIRN